MTGIADLLRPVLEDRARTGRTITYGDLARLAGVPPPHTIHKTGEALETLMAADAATGRPFLSAVAISKARGGLPAPGFFQTAAALGRYFGADRGSQAATYHALELEKVWSAYAGGTPEG